MRKFGFLLAVLTVINLASCDKSSKQDNDSKAQSDTAVAQAEDTTAQETQIPEKVTYNFLDMLGTMANVPVEVKMTISSDGDITGSYFYTKNSGGGVIPFSGKYNKVTREAEIEEVFDGKITGRWRLNIEINGNAAKANGTITNFKNKEHEVKLTGSVTETDAPMAGADVDNAEEYSAPDTSYSDTGNINVDEWLDKMDRLVEKTIAINKKVKQGDRSAIIQYSTLCEEYEERTKEFEKLQNKFSASQYERYSRIISKMMSQN